MKESFEFLYSLLHCILYVRFSLDFHEIFLTSSAFSTIYVLHCMWFLKMAHGQLNITFVLIFLMFYMLSNIYSFIVAILFKAGRFYRICPFNAHFVNKKLDFKQLHDTRIQNDITNITSQFYAFLLPSSMKETSSGSMSYLLCIEIKNKDNETLDRVTLHELHYDSNYYK